MDLGAAVLYSLIPAATATLAFFISFFTKLKSTTLHVIQAVGSGVLLAAIVFAVVPRFLHSDSVVSVLILLRVGFLLLLVLKSVLRHKGGAGAGNSQLSFLVAFCVEFFVNGILIGVTSTLDAKTTALIAFSLCVCSLACGMSFVTRLVQSGYTKRSTVLWTAFIICLFPLGAVLGHAVLHSYMTLLPPILAFEAGVLIYLAILDLFMMAFMGSGSKTPVSVAFIGGLWMVLLIHFAM